MSESQGPRATPSPPTGAAGGAAPAEAPITLHLQYIKDLSFEAPGAPRVFQHLQQNPPEISVSIDVRAGNLQPDVYEVVIRVHAECKAGDAVGFIVELVYGGTFTLKVPAEQLELVLLIECPRLLFPFARYIIADVTRDGGFPPLLISPVDFVQMYRERKMAAQAQATQAAAGTVPVSPAKSGS